MPKPTSKLVRKLGNRTLNPRRQTKMTFRQQLTPDHVILTMLLVVSGGVAIAQGGVWIAILLYIINILALLRGRQGGRDEH